MGLNNGGINLLIGLNGGMNYRGELHESGFLMNLYLIALFKTALKIESPKGITKRELKNFNSNQ